METKCLISYLMLMTVTLASPGRIFAQQAPGSDRELPEPKKLESNRLHPIGRVKKSEEKTTKDVRKPKADDAKPELEIRILFDNTSAHKSLSRSWGFSALIDYRGKRILFDSGSDPTLLLEHMDKLKIDPKSIDEAIISHHHSDHRRGIYWVFEKNSAMKVHFLDSFDEEAYRAATQVKMKPNRVKGPFQLMPGVYSTGPIDGLPPEQSLLIETSQGLVMIVGCSHPGIVKMVETAMGQRKKDSVRLLLGGFHLLKTEPEQIRKIVNRLDELKVKMVVPAHCTGELATEMIQSLYGREGAAGAGRWIVVDRKGVEFRIMPVK